MPASEEELRNADLFELTARLTKDAFGGSDWEAQTAFAILIRLAEPLAKAVKETAEEIKAFNDSSKQLTKRIICLNWVLVGATVVLAVVGLLNVAVAVIDLAFR